MPCPTPVWRTLACLFGLTGVILGALGAHALTDPHAIVSVERASLYQLLHAIVLLILAPQPGRLATLARLAFTLGVVLFCGGIYLKYLSAYAWAGTVTPYGGMALMVGWLLAAWAGWARRGA